MPPMPTLKDYFPPTEPYLDVLHVDEDILVVNKQSGLLSVPGKDPSLWDCVEHRARQAYPTAGMCHRLDKDTSGVLVLALNKRAHGRIGSQFDAGHERAFRCRSIHGGAMQHVSRAHHQFAVDEPRDRSKLMGDTDIDHGDLDPGMAGQHVDSSSAAKKVQHHLSGDIPRIGADAFVDDTMIGGKCEHPTARDGRL